MEISSHGITSFNQSLTWQHAVACRPSLFLMVVEAFDETPS
ncbi:hypothetical protein CK203_085701 [Vitis vinifera]|uniref:Uncharacterized protein n=1 Tax=Vitis vinifera TaxID=29760 RepID=A0A438BLR6_VITVI|nr:hypothetical protein CK203_085701 [Vitis vinifera]